MSLRRKRHEISHQNKPDGTLPTEEKMALIVGGSEGGGLGVCPLWSVGSWSHGARGREGSSGHCWAVFPSSSIVLAAPVAVAGACPRTSATGSHTECARPGSNQPPLIRDNKAQTVGLMLITQEDWHLHSATDFLKTKTSVFNIF